MSKIRVMIVDDHAVVREGQRALIEFEPNMELVGEACDGMEAVDLAKKASPDVILMDLKMPRMNGIEAIKLIKEDNPESKILVLTSFAEDEQVYQSIKAGALGYLLKDASPKEILNAIKIVNQGESLMDSVIAKKLMNEIQRKSDLPLTKDPLSVRETEVLIAVARGLSNQHIGEELFISERTVRTHVSHILQKLQLANRTQATLYALREGLADLNK
jgi:NarL family two-component system response regulator LiaR